MSTMERPWAARRKGRSLALTGVTAVALLGGLTIGAHSAGATVTGTRIQICKAGQVSGSASFSLNNSATPIAVQVGHCVSVGTTAGANTVRELPDPTGATVLSAINIRPVTAGTGNIATRTATVNVPEGGSPVTQFINSPATSVLKVCKVAGDPALLGHQFSFTETAGGSTVGPTSVTAGSPGDLVHECTDVSTYQVGTKVNIAELATPGVAVSNIQVLGGSAGNVNLAAGTVTATVGSGVTDVVYTNVPVVVQPPGYIEVCKSAADSFVPSGPWTFTLNQGNWNDTEHVLTGQCTGPITVPAGQVSVQESVSSPSYVSSITAIPAGNLLGSNLANGQATFAVASGADTTAVFTNSTQMGYVKVCKTLRSGSDSLTGMPFTFNVNDVAGTQTVTVIASPPGQTACVPDFTALPVGSVATITEQSVPNVALVGVSVVPASADAGSSSATARVTVGTSMNSAIFTNAALGWMEVCKNAADASTAGHSFNFSVNGGLQFPVMTGQCSQPMQVPVGTASVQEFLPNSNYQLANVSTVSVTDPTGSRLLSGSMSNPAIVAVPYGGVGNETIVTFTNSVVQSAFKICSQQTSPDANLLGRTFPYAYSYTVNGTTTTGSVSLTLVDPTGSNPTGYTCSGIIGLIPVVNQDGSSVNVSVTSQPPNAVSVNITGAQYQGNGSVVSAPPLPTGFPATLVFALGSGMNVTTWTNGATH
jgi:hypothetical protein